MLRSFKQTKKNMSQQHTYLQNSNAHLCNICTRENLREVARLRARLHVACTLLYPSHRTPCILSHACNLHLGDDLHERPHSGLNFFFPARSVGKKYRQSILKSHMDALVLAGWLRGKRSRSGMLSIGWEISIVISRSCSGTSCGFCARSSPFLSCTCGPCTTPSSPRSRRHRR
jgi:hypothetical protein